MSLKRWRTPEIIELLTDPKWEITNIRQGGDFDSEGLCLRLVGDETNNRLFVRGFNPDEENPTTTPEDCMVEMIEVSDMSDSRGGLNITDRPFGYMYVEVRARLNEADFMTVICMDEYY